MSTILKSLNALFADRDLFQVLVQAPHTLTNQAPKTLVCHLNPIHSSHIHVVEKDEAAHLNSLTNTELTQLVDQLSKKHASHIAFQNQHNIPAPLLEQNKISILRFTSSTQSLFHYLQDAVQNIATQECTLHGSMVVVFGQGILITGNSGAGKSTLLLSLIERGHLWVADDAPRIYLNHLGHLYGANSGHLSEYIHTKNIGAINADQTFGKSKRVPHHRLAAIIHLNDEINKKEASERIFSGYKNITILNQTIPQWHILKNAHQTDSNAQSMQVETIAKQLILNNWGNNAAQALILAHDFAVH